MKKHQIITIIILISFITYLSIGSLIKKDESFSDNENRVLKTSISINPYLIKNGDTQEDLEDYINDQIIHRDGFMALKSTVDYAMGNRQINGAYMGKEGYIFERITPEDVNDKTYNYNLSVLKDFFCFCTSKIDKSRISFILVPTSGFVMAEDLPKGAYLFDQKSYIDEATEFLSDYNIIPATSILMEHKNDAQVFYKTDHHWTSDGAYYVALDYLNSVGFDYSSIQLNRKIITSDFRGSLYSKVLYPFSSYDDIVIYDNDSDTSVIIDDKEYASLYFMNKLDSKDKYTVFCGGNYGRMDIRESNDSNRKLLLIKDSFANCFIPFLADNYDEITVIDMRYMKTDLRTIFESDDYTDVLVLYNISNFVSDKNFILLK